MYYKKKNKHNCFTLLVRDCNIVMKIEHVSLSYIISKDVYIFNF